MRPRSNWCRWLISLAVVGSACGPSTPAPAHGPILDVSQAELTFFATPGGEDPSEEIDIAEDEGDGTLEEPTATIQYGSGAGWLEASVSGSQAPYAVSVKPTVGSLPAGTYTASVSVASPGAANSPRTVAVTLKVSHTLPRTLAGQITFDKVPPFKTSKSGLDYASTRPYPVQGARVELLDAGTGAVIESGVTTDDGRYRFAWDTGQNLVKVRISAQTVKPKIRVLDNYGGKNRLFAGVTEVVDASAVSEQSWNLGSGWDATSKTYATSRAAAPFAVLDAAYRAARAFLAARPAIAFPDLAIHWSENNRKEGNFTLADYKDGRINTSHWSLDKETQGLWILGKEGQDTDEYDSHIIVHEWGHYFESMVSRSDSPGDHHLFGTRKDPRLAWGEGWATALGGIVFHPDTVYVDTRLLQQSDSDPFFDIEDNEDSDPRSGWFSEMSVVHVFYDLWDPPRANDKEKAFDQVQLPLGALYDVMAGAQKSTPAFTTLFSFVDGLKRAIPDQATAIDTLLKWKGVATPVQDAYGTNEKNDGGYSFALPVYTELKVTTPNSTPTTFGFRGVGDGTSFYRNELETCRLAHFTGTGGNLVIWAKTEGVGVRVTVYEEGSTSGWEGGAVPGDKDKGKAKPLETDVAFYFPTKAAVRYRAILVSTDKKDKPFTAAVLLYPYVP